MGQRPPGQAAWWFGAAVAGVALLLALCAAAGGVHAAGGDEVAEAVLEGGYRLCPDAYVPCTCGSYRLPHGAHSKHDRHQATYAEQSYTDQRDRRKFCCCPAPAPVTCKGQPPAVANVTWVCPVTVPGGNCTAHCPSGCLSTSCPFGLVTTATATCGRGGAWGAPVGSACHLPKVLLIATDTRVSIENVLTTVDGTGAFASVETFDAQVATPTLDKLQAYDALLVFGAFGFQDPVGLGDVMAQFWNAGGGVVVALFANFEGVIRGAWAEDGYQLISASDSVDPVETKPIIPVESGSPLLEGVTALNATSAFQAIDGLADYAIVVARWGSAPNRPLIVRGVKARPDGSSGNLVGLNMYPPNDRAIDWVGNGAQMMRNALQYSAVAAAP